MMNRIGMLGMAAGAMLTLSSAGMAAQVKEQAQIPGRNGAMRNVELLKTGKKLETVSCRDFGVLDESYRPQAVVYAANYGPRGKAHPTATVEGVERVVPMVVQQCKVRPGNHFLTAVDNAMAAARRSR